MFKKSLEEGHPGDSLGVLLRNVKKDDIRRGMAIVKPGSFVPTDHVKAQVYLLDGQEGGRNKAIITETHGTVFCNTFDCNAKFEFEGKEVSFFFLDPLNYC